MTRIFTAGFESGNAVGFSAGGGTAVVSTVNALEAGAVVR
jgi:hypothetical protein